MILRALSALWTSFATPMANHLWQSTLFVVLAAILAFALRRNQGRVRYWVWLTASMKFLIPFSLFIALGSHLATPRVSTPAQTVVYSAVQDFSQPFAGPETPLIPQAPPPLRSAGFICFPDHRRSVACRDPRCPSGVGDRLDPGFADGAQSCASQARTRGRSSSPPGIELRLCASRSSLVLSRTLDGAWDLWHLPSRVDMA